MRTRSVCIALTACLTVLLSGSSSRALDILLTNDDGWDAPGIQVVRGALLAANHDVTLVAPCDNQSGSSARFSSDSDVALALTEQAPGQWCVDGSPADAVAAGFDVVLAGQNVDLVVSGANFGQNVGRVTNHSGTVGATITAARNEKTPAIALSVGVDPDVFLGGELDPLKTILAFPGAAALLVRVIDRLENNGKYTDLLPEDLAININYPGVGSDSPEGVAITRIDDSSVILPGFEDNGDGTITPAFEINFDVIFRVLILGMPNLRSEGEALLAGYATLSPMNGTWGVAQTSYKCDMEKRIEGFDTGGLSLVGFSTKCK